MDASRNFVIACVSDALSGVDLDTALARLDRLSVIQAKEALRRLETIVAALREIAGED